MKHITLQQIKQKSYAIIIGITLAIYPLSALAAYVQSPGNPLIKELDGTDTITGEYKIVGTIEIPQTKMDNLIDETKKVLSSVKPKEKVMTPEQRDIAILKSEILAREMMIARLQGERK